MKRYKNTLRIKDNGPFISPPKGSDFSGQLNIKK